MGSAAFWGFWGRVFGLGNLSCLAGYRFVLIAAMNRWTGGIYGGFPELPPTGPEATPVPSTLDWDLWLGNAEPRAFNPMMTSRWRAFIDFSTGGSMGDWLVHNLWACSSGVAVG